MDYTLYVVIERRKSKCEQKHSLFIKFNFHSMEPFTKILSNKKGK